MTGNLETGRNGSLVYTIPIEVAPGRGGVQPSLALQYDSQIQESGILGVGWKLVGLPEIQPCAQTLAQDARARSARANANDEFCLGQKRLIRITPAGTNTTVQYRIENEEFTNVIAFTGASGYPNSFELHTKDGMVAMLVPIVANRSSKALKWGPSQIYRTGYSGNPMRVSYSSSGTFADLNVQDQSPSQISYNTFSLDAANTIGFIYKGDSAQHMSTMDGTLVGEGRQLDRIAVYAQNGAYATAEWEYYFKYEPDPLTSLRRLKSIQRCDTKGNCLTPMTFSYSGSAISRSSSVSSEVLDWGQDYGRAWVDVNGDGKADYCRVIDSGQGTRAACTLSTGSGFGATWISDVLDAGVADKSRTWVDANGDGRADFCRKTANGTQLSCTMMTDQGFGNTIVSSNFSTNTTMVPFAWIDADLDGRVDFCQFQNSTSSVTCAMSTGAGFVAKPPVILNGASIPAAYADDAEFTGTNGQGLTFLCFRAPSGDGPAIQCADIDTGVVSQANFPGTWGDAGTRKWIDVNGDGIADYCFSSRSDIWGQAGYSCYNFFPFQNYGGVNQGLALADPGIAASTKWVDMGSGWRRHFCRVTGNGKPGTMICSAVLVNGGGFSFTMQDAGVDKKGFGWADVSGSGVPAYCRLTGTVNLQDSRIECEILSGGAGLINKISNGLGHEISISYTRLTDSSTYTKGTTAVYPERDVITGPSIVNNVVSLNGSGGSLTTRYTYSELREDLRGRGKEGFRLVTTQSLDTGITSVTQYRQDFPYTGMLLSSTTKGPTGAKLKQLDNTFDCMDFVSPSGCVPANGRVYFPFVSQTTSASWDLNGATLPSTTTTMQYDSYGNPTKVTSSSSDGYTKTVDTIYSNDTSKWWIGRPTRVTVTSSAQ
ncbi:hypothetical protein GTP91_24800 [Rugamonas sp. FT82W]|uniref:Insecticide toxin TcdB middle/N-terminal domain-containing protein n=1 Tax=Duganella vulcania TaxID=2692166 RepID=A0A845GBX2_9BURK|nr:hypothetical protein [Duganella vulcania]